MPDRPAVPLLCPCCAPAVPLLCYPKSNQKGTILAGELSISGLVACLVAMEPPACAGLVLGTRGVTYAHPAALRVLFTILVTSELIHIVAAVDR